MKIVTLDDFIKPQQQHLITEAIAKAEKECSAEIRIHLTPRCRFSVIKAATKVFNRLEMYLTRHRNGVLIYIAPLSRKIAIIGDEGINNLVDDNYWQNEYETLAKRLANGEIVEGIIETIERIGKKLALHFPPEIDDENELSDEISFSR